MAAAAEAQWSVSADASRLFGNTTYRLDALSVSPSNPNDVYPISSELVFPLDVWLAGVTADWQLPSGKWQLGASVATNTNDPTDKMTDSDWERGQFVQYTESDAALKLLRAGVDARRKLSRPGPVSLWLLGRADYEKTTEDITGFNGWYYSEPLQREVPIFGTGPALYYDVRYLSGQAGLGLSGAVPQALDFRVQWTAGVVSAHDRDDHLLRGRISTGDATGFATRASLEASRPIFHAGPVPVTVGLRGDYRYCRADGTTTETWYRTEQTPGGPIPAGTSYTGIPHSFRSSLFALGLRVGVEF